MVCPLPLSQSPKCTYIQVLGGAVENHWCASPRAHWAAPPVPLALFFPHNHHPHFCASLTSRHHPLAEDMLRLLEDSGRSMRELATDTKEQQREWWRERVALDECLAALLQSMGAEWLSGWR